MRLAQARGSLAIEQKEERGTEYDKSNQNRTDIISDSDSQFMSKSKLTFIAENNCTCLDWIKERTLVVAELLQKLQSLI